jgi:hypothetical protein
VATHSKTSLLLEGASQWAATTAQSAWIEVVLSLVGRLGAATLGASSRPWWICRSCRLAEGYGGGWLAIRAARVKAGGLIPLTSLGASRFLARHRRRDHSQPRDPGQLRLRVRVRSDASGALCIPRVFSYDANQRQAQKNSPSGDHQSESTRGSLHSQSPALDLRTQTQRRELQKLSSPNGAV